MDKILQDIRRIRDEREWASFHTLENLAKSIMIEAGELLECFQWDNKYDLKEVSDELADVMIYCLSMTDALGVCPKEIVMSKIEKNEKKYPVKQAKGNSKKYTEFK